MSSFEKELDLLKQRAAAAKAASEELETKRLTDRQEQLELEEQANSARQRIIDNGLPADVLGTENFAALADFQRYITANQIKVEVDQIITRRLIFPVHVLRNVVKKGLFGRVISTKQELVATAAPEQRVDGVAIGRIAQFAVHFCSDERIRLSSPSDRLYSSDDQDLTNGYWVAQPVTELPGGASSFEPGEFVPTFALQSPTTYGEVIPGHDFYGLERVEFLNSPSLASRLAQLALASGEASAVS